MGFGVSTEKAAIQGGMGCCKVSIHELETATRALIKGYQKAGEEGWDDKKYAALGGIVEECCHAMTKPIGELQECLVKLQELFDAVENYESTNL